MAGVHYMPETVEELSELVRETKGPIVVGVGHDSGVGWPTPIRSKLCERARTALEALIDRQRVGEQPLRDVAAAEQEFWEGITCIELSRFDDVIEFHPEDQVMQVGTSAIVPSQKYMSAQADASVTAASGTLRQELKRSGQCLPCNTVLADGSFETSLQTVGRGIAINFPHCLQAQCGSWRDWVLGMTVVLADGTVVKTGSKAVKSVAGYDVHKLMIGAYDTLGIVVDVTLRTFPLKALPEPDLTWGRAQEKFKGETIQGRNVWRQRGLRSCYADALNGAGNNLLYGDNASFTLWCWLDSPDQELPRYPGDWVVRTGCGEKNVQITDPTQIRFMKRAKAIFDPDGKLNPGEFGFL